MLPLRFKVVLFLVLWHEIAGQFGLGADAAFVAALFVFFGTWLLRHLAVELAGLSQPLTAALLARGALWIILYFWLAPGFLRALPVTFIVAGVIGLAMLGAHGRRTFDQKGYTLGKPFFHERSEAVVAGVMSGLAACFLAQRHWGSVLPLVGYASLLGLPLSFGWEAAGPRPEIRADAKFGDEDMWSDVGVSDEY